MQEEELLRKLGEETIYSAKGHFKACDLRRNLFTVTIWSCMILNLIGIMGFHPTVDKWSSILGLFGTIALLLWNEGEGKNYREKHKEAGEKYLALHKEVRSCYHLHQKKIDMVEKLSQRVISFDQSERPDIPGVARWWAKMSIEGKNSETDNWFLSKNGNK